jgi:hypothetical protein
MDAHRITFTRDTSSNGTGVSAAETVPGSIAPAPGTTRFNRGFRVFWMAGGEPVFRDHTGKVRPISLTTLRDLRRALWTMARETSGRQRDRLCTLWAEADEALTDTVRWRQAACGIFLIREQVA